jgi:pimeloyl-ACP methyl ester carboxylesterase
MSSPDPSATDRPSVDQQYRGARRVIRALETVSPDAAAAVAEALFVRTNRPVPRPDERAWLAASRRLTISTNGHRIQVYQWGPEDAPLVLCAHGWWSHAGRFVALADPLLGAGLRVAAFDAPGHGRSSGWRASMPEFARTIQAVGDHLGSIDTIVGHSLGGAASLYALSRGLVARRAVALAAPSNLAVWADRFRDALALSPRVDARMRERLSNRLNFAWSDLEMSRVAPEVSVPGLVIHDVDDVDVPIADGRRLAASWPGARLVETRGLGHRRILRDDAVIRRVAEFVLGRDQNGL